MWLRRNSANIITLLNLLSGSMAIVMVFNQNLMMAAILVIVSAIFDFLDGFVARILGAYSNIGKELDSLADLVSFGLVPSGIMYTYLDQSLEGLGVYFSDLNIFALPAFLIVLLSALRLAIFNLDETQSDSFKGLPTPANAFFIISMPLTLEFGNTISFPANIVEIISGHYWALLIFTLTVSLLLVSPIRMLAFKFKDFSIRNNKFRYIFLTLSLILLLVYQMDSLPIVMFLYLLLSVVFHITNRRSGNATIREGNI